MRSPNSLNLNSKSWSWLEVRSGGLFLMGEGFVDPIVTRRFRERLRSQLGKQPDVEEVLDLFEPNETELQLRFASNEVMCRFLPLICLLRLSLAEGRGKASIPCIILMDGYVVLIGMVLSEKPEFVLADRISDEIYGYGNVFREARDRIVNVVKGVAQEAKMVPPVMTHGGLLVTNGSKLDTSTNLSIINLRDASIATAIKQVYIELERDATSFYLKARTADSARSMSHEISLRTSELLKLIQAFVETSTTQVMTRRSIRKKIRLAIAAVLDLVTQHAKNKAEVEGRVQSLEDRFRVSNVSSNFFREIGWREYIECGRVDTDTTLTVIDHARSEIESSGIESMTMWAAVVSALVVSLVTMLSLIYRPVP